MRSARVDSPSHILELLLSKKNINIPKDILISANPKQLPFVVEALNRNKVLGDCLTAPYTNGKVTYELLDDACTNAVDKWLSTNNGHDIPLKSKGAIAKLGISGAKTVDVEELKSQVQSRRQRYTGHRHPTTVTLPPINQDSKRSLPYEQRTRHRPS